MSMSRPREVKKTPIVGKRGPRPDLKKPGGVLGGRGLGAGHVCSEKKMPRRSTGPLEFRLRIACPLQQDYAGALGHQPPYSQREVSLTSEKTCVNRGQATARLLLASIGPRCWVGVELSLGLKGDPEKEETLKHPSGTLR